MNVKTDTIVRTIILVIALINQILTATGHTVLPFSDEEIANGISVVFTVVASIWAWWKNNSFTLPAIKGDELKDQLKAEARKHE